METLIELIKNNKISYKDVTTFHFICEFPLKSARDLAIISGMNYSRLTESIKILLKFDLIIRTDERPNKYLKNET